MDYAPSHLIEAAQAGDVEARNDLISRNMGLIRTIIAKQVPGPDVDEYLASAVQGFVKSIDQFDPAAGAKFTTYAAHGVRFAVSSQRVKDRGGKLGRLSVPICAVGPIGDRRAGVLDRMESAEDVAIVNDAALRLPAREAFIYERRASGETFREVGARLGLSRERVRQLEVRARSRLFADVICGAA